MPAPATLAVRVFRFKERLRMSLWLVPSLGVVAAVVLSFGLVALDRRVEGGPIFFLQFKGGAESARNLLSVIAGSMVTSISLIFSVTMVVLQLASAQFSPRILRTFIRDRLVQVVLAVYIATFVYSLLVLPTVRSQPAESEFVPGIAVTVALVLALGSLGLFVRYVHHISHAIRASTVINTIAAETRASLDELYPEEVGDEAEPGTVPPRGPPSQVVTWPDGPGVVVAVDDSVLMEVATEHQAVVELLVRVGEFVPTGLPIFHVHGGHVDGSRLCRCLSVDEERTIAQDSAYGFRQLVDIAERALSPGLNDPTTAVQVVDHLHDMLRRLARRRFPSELRVDGSGELRVVAPAISWDGYVHLSFDEIRHYGSGSMQILRRLLAALGDLLTVAPPHRQPALRSQLWLVEEAIARGFPDHADRLAAHRDASAG